MGKDNEDKEDAKPDRRHREEINGYEIIDMVVRGRPARSGSAACADGPCIWRRSVWEMSMPSLSSSPWMQWRAPEGVSP